MPGPAKGRVAIGSRRLRRTKWWNGDEQPRVAAAQRAAIELAARCGVVVEGPRLLHDSNNVVVHLAPAAIVAKVGASSHRPDAAASLARELEVGRFLAARHAPSARPSSLLAPGRYREGGSVVTLWDYCPHDPGREVDGPSAGRSLAELHAVLAGYGGPLPPFTVQIEHAAHLLQTHPLPALAPSDRAFLTETHGRLSVALATYRFAARPLHGEAHLGNVLATDDGPCWIDFEAACVGPVEWDLAGLGSDAAAHYPDADHDLLGLMGELRSFCVAVWCWTNPDRAPELRQAAEHHLQRLRAYA